MLEIHFKNFNIKNRLRFRVMDNWEMTQKNVGKDET